MDIKEFDKMMEEFKEFDDFEFKAHVPWGHWMGDLDIDSILKNSPLFSIN